VSEGERGEKDTHHREILPWLLIASIAFNING